MAVVQNPFLSTAARGSLFGLTASFVRGGAVVKKKSNPATKYEPYQNRARSILGYVARYWGNLTDAQRDSWAAWAIDHPGTDKFGDPFIMSGFNAFVKLNVQVIRYGAGSDLKNLPPEDPPISSMNMLTAVTGVGNPGEVDLTWTELGVGIEADVWEIQVAGPFQSMGRKSVRARFAFKQFVVGSLLLATVAGLDEGMYYWFLVRYIADDGQITAPGIDQATPMLTP